MPKKSFLDEMDLQIIRGDEGKTKKKASRQAKIFTCADCGLNMQCQTPKFPVWGKGKKKILIVLDTPSLNEDENGEPWSSVRGMLIKELLEDRIGLSLRRDCWTTYAVRCCAKKNIKAPQSEACRKYLHQDIADLDPEIIIPFGYWAMIGVSGDILTNKSRGKKSDEWAGYNIPDQRFLKWICPTYDSYLLQIDNKKPDVVRIEQFVNHIDKAISLLGTPIEKIDYQARVTPTQSPGRIAGLLDSIQKDADTREDKLILSLDYETTGRKPHRQGHEIVSIAISNGKKAWSFPNKKDPVIWEQFARLLTHENIYWRVHNVQFEWLWSYNIFGVWPRNLDHDTILGVHTLNSQKRKGLKPTIYCLFGVAGYDDAIDEYISAPAQEEKMYGANGFNLMKQAPIDECLVYDGMDALFTYLLAEYIDTNIIKRCRKGYKFLMESAINLVKAQENGMRVDTKGVAKAKEELTIEMERLDKEIQKLARKSGWDKYTPFRPSAGADIAKLLFEIMGYDSTKETASGGQSTDKEAIEKIKEPIVPVILEWKRLQKLRDTYINGLVTEVIDELMHPFFNLYTVVTYRSSSDSFNFQNVPKRDKRSNKIIRSLLYPHRGQKINEYDYKGIEVAVSACYNKDTNLIKYVSDPTTDMHRDTGAELFLYDDRMKLSKDDRQCAKNSFVFPSFYGSYFQQTAPDLWEKCTPEARENLRSHGIKKLGIMNERTRRPEPNTFLEHVMRIEKSFWEDRFPEYTEWKKAVYASYLKKGYVDSLTGFRYYGPMSKNEVLNICIQGSAHHVLLRTFNKVSDVIERKNMKTRMIGQIHDSMLPSVEPDEEKYLDKVIWYYGTQEIYEEFKWIIVPIQIEKSSGAIDAPWSEVQELGLLGENGRLLK